MNETALMRGNLMEDLLPAMGCLPSIVRGTSRPPGQYRRKTNGNLSLPLPSNFSDCGGIEFGSFRYLGKHLPKFPHFGLEFQADLAF